MKPAIHPTWYPDALVTCACGNTWTTGSTKKEIHTDVCSNCHPFFTGEQRIVDTAGQVERFMKRINAKEQIAASTPAPEEKRSKKDKRRVRRGGAVAEPEPPMPPAELPVAKVVRAQAAAAPTELTAVAPEPGVTEVGPVVEPGDMTPARDQDIAPAGIIGDVASVDKIIEPAARRPAGPRKPRAPRKPATGKPKAELTTEAATESQAASQTESTAGPESAPETEPKAESITETPKTENDQEPSRSE